MASTLDIGRVGLDFDLDKVVQWDIDENTVTVRGWIKGTATSAPIIRQQLLGYVDSPQWERVVPVVAASQGSGRDRLGSSKRRTSVEVRPRLRRTSTAPGRESVLAIREV